MGGTTVEEMTGEGGKTAISPATEPYVQLV